jgi:hypothetical protein
MPWVATLTAQPLAVLTRQPRTTGGPPRHHQHDNGDQCRDDYGDDGRHAYPSSRRRPDAAVHLSSTSYPSTGCSNRRRRRTTWRLHAPGLGGPLGHDNRSHWVCSEATKAVCHRHNQRAVAARVARRSRTCHTAVARARIASYYGLAHLDRARGRAIRSKSAETGPWSATRPHRLNLPGGSQQVIVGDGAVPACQEQRQRAVFQFVGLTVMAGDDDSTTGAADWRARRLRLYQWGIGG